MQGERRRFLGFFGPSFLSDESVAIDNMLHMLSYQQSLLALAEGESERFNDGSEDTALQHQLQHPAQSPMQPPPQLQPTASTTAEGVRKMNMHEIFNSVIRPSSTSNTTSTTSAHTPSARHFFMRRSSQVEDEGMQVEGAESASKDGGEDEEVDAIYLPRFVREPLQRMRLAKSPTGNVCSFTYTLCSCCYAAYSMFRRS